jgi:hypothetical protein
VESGTGEEKARRSARFEGESRMMKGHGEGEENRDRDRERKRKTGAGTGVGQEEG